MVCLGLEPGAAGWKVQMKCSLVIVKQKEVSVSILDQGFWPSCYNILIGLSRPIFIYFL